MMGELIDLFLFWLAFAFPGQAGLWPFWQLFGSLVIFLWDRMDGTFHFNFGGRHSALPSLPMLHGTTMKNRGRQGAGKP